MTSPNKIEKWLINEKIKQDAIDVIKAIEPDSEHPIRVVIHDKKITRSEKQNKYLFGWVYGCALSILNDSGIELKPGMAWTKDAFHSAMAETFLIKGEYELPSGRIITIRHSTANLPKKSKKSEESNEPTFPWYVEQVKQFCEQHWGFQIPDPVSPQWVSLMEEVMG